MYRSPAYSFGVLPPRVRRIEQLFRHAKNLLLGFGLSSARSRGAQRLEMLLLLIHLASFVQLLTGESLRQQQLEVESTTRSRRDRPEVSVLTLARRWLDAPGRIRRRCHLAGATTSLRQQVMNTIPVPV